MLTLQGFVKPVPGLSINAIVIKSFWKTGLSCSSDNKIILQKGKERKGELIRVFLASLLLET